MILSRLPRLSSLFIFLPGILLGSTLVVTRFSLGQFETQTYVALRLMGGALTFLIAYAIFRARPWPRDPKLWLRAGFYGIIGTAITMTAFTQSLRYQSSGVTGLLSALSPIETALMAHFLLRGERLTRRRVLGALVAFAGTGLLLIRGESGLAELSRADWRGYAWAMLGVLTNSAGLVYARHFLKNDDAFVVTSIRIMVGAGVIALLTAGTVGYDFSQVRWSGVAAVLYAAVAGTFLAFLFYLSCVQRFGATAASQSEYLVPPVSAALGVLLLHERFTLTMLAGMLVIFAGLWLFDRAGSVRTAEPPPALTAPEGHDRIPVQKPSRNP